jgi:hypothetical protein
MEQSMTDLICFLIGIAVGMYGMRRFVEFRVHEELMKAEQETSELLPKEELDKDDSIEAWALWDTARARKNGMWDLAKKVNLY